MPETGRLYHVSFSPIQMERPSDMSLPTGGYTAETASAAVNRGTRFSFRVSGARCCVVCGG